MPKYRDWLTFTGQVVLVFKVSSAVGSLWLTWTCHRTISTLGTYSHRPIHLPLTQTFLYLVFKSCLFEGPDQSAQSLDHIAQCQVTSLFLSLIVIFQDYSECNSNLFSAYTHILQYPIHVPILNFSLLYQQVTEKPLCVHRCEIGEKHGCSSDRWHGD